MARKSRKETAAVAVQEADATCRAAIYVRLSVEDTHTHSVSIETQQMIIAHYLEQYPEISVYDTYIDNGATGTNFHRSGFQQMLSDIEAGHVNCVIVKDLSRLGRNTIDTGYYIEQYFRIRNIRFIAVNENFDTANPEDAHSGIIIPLRNMINEAYALDIGRKIKAQQRQAMKDGKFIGARTPYGYLKAEDDAAPVAGGGYDTVSPAGVSVILFLIVQKVSVEFPHNIVFVAEHEKSCRSGMLLPIRADAHGTQLQEKIFILQRLPYMTGAGKAHPLAIATDALLVEHGHIHLIQDEHVLGFHRSIPHHRLILFLGTAVVALTVAAVGAEWIAIHINRLIRALCTGNIDDHNAVTIYLLDEYIFGGQDIHTGLVGVIGDIPEFLDESVRVGQIYRVQGFIRPFFHSQQDNATVGIGKS